MPPPSPQEPPPRKAAKTSTKEIHIDQDGEKYGPYNLEKVNDFLEEGRISSSAIAWHKGLSDWIPITEIDGVVAPEDEGPPLRPPNKPTPDEPPPKRKLQPEKDTGEKVYYDNNNVLVTSNRYVVEDELGNPITYAIKNITSVTTGTYEVEKEGGCIKWIVGATGIAILAFLWQKYDWDYWVFFVLCLVLGATIGIISFFFEEDEYFYSVDNVTASGNHQSYTSHDKQEIGEIVNALNEAIING